MTSHEIPALRRAARAIWEAALHAADPAVFLLESFRFEPSRVQVLGQNIAYSGNVIIIGAGKASARMAQVLEQEWPELRASGVIVTKYGHRIPLSHIDVVEAGHPIPDENGVSGVHKTLEILAKRSANDLVLCLISGGGSALWPAPAPGVTLEEKRQVTSELMNAGADIRQLNAVRKHLSTLKGGQLLRWTHPATTVSLIVSDVVGDPLDFIASGPTAADTSTFHDALSILKGFDIRIPASVLDRLERGVRGEIAETVKVGDPLLERVHNFVVASNRTLVHAASQRAEALGFSTEVLSMAVTGDAGRLADQFVAIATEAVQRFPKRPLCVLAAGETTVTVRGHGKGGRNQEIAARVALGIRGTGRNVVFASVASDGTDGPTDAAGGLVDAGTWNRVVQAGWDPKRLLDENDSWTFLGASGDRIETGPTGTNLMDLQILLIR